MKKYLILSLLAIGMISCSEDSIKTFQPSETAVAYFQIDQNTSQSPDGTQIFARYYVDSTYRSFGRATSDVEFLYHSLPIKVMGRTVNYDRKIDVKLNKELSTGIDNKDFVVKYDSVFLKAGESVAYLSVKLLRTPRLLKETVKLAFDLVDNENFKILEKYNNCDVWSSTTSVLSGRTIKIAYDEFVKAPVYWSPGVSLSVYSFYGDWSAKKFNIVNTTMGWILEDWDYFYETGAKIQYGTVSYSAYLVRAYLQAQADAKEPIREVDGTLMQLGKDYRVDYSNYK